MQTDADHSDDRKRDNSSHRKKMKLANDTNNHTGKANAHECTNKTKSNAKKLSLFQCIEDSDDSEGPASGATRNETADDKSEPADGGRVTKNQIKVAGHKAASVPESDREGDDASSTSSCSCEDHSSVASQSDDDDDPHGDLDYDEDSITNSPANPSNGLKPINDASGPDLTGAISEKDQEAATAKVDANISPLDRLSDSGLNLAEKQSHLDKELGEQDRVVDEGKKCGQRIKSFISFDHQVDEEGSGPELLNQTKKTSKDRSHKSYEGLLKYFFKDACYFQIKSINHENVEISKRLGIWSTLVQNDIRFNTAFREHRNIILIFSVQQSGAFQGFARMVSESEPARGPLPWILPPRLGNVKLGGIFKVEWLCTKELPFPETSELFNPLNDNKPIKVARDGQQVEPKVGKKLCQLFPRDSKKRLLNAIETLKHHKDRANQRNQDIYPFNDALNQNPMRHNDLYYTASHPMGEMTRSFNGKVAMPPDGAHYDPIYPPTTFRARRHMTGQPGGPFLYPPNEYYVTSRTAELGRNGYHHHHHHHVPPSRPFSNHHPFIMEPTFSNHYPPHHQRVEYGMEDHMGGITHHHYPHHPPMIDEWVPNMEMHRYHGNQRFRR